jgi:trehalose/maltose transport system substrate-binding protein
MIVNFLEENRMSQNTLRFMICLLALLTLFAVQAVAAQDEVTIECAEGPADITIAAGAVGVELEVVQAQAARYVEACPGINVSVLETIDSATDRLALYQQFWAQESPEVDIYQVDVIWAGIIAEHMVDLYEYLPQEYIDQFFPAMVAGQTIEGRLVAIPWFTDAPGLYYRTDLLEEYGYDAPPATWDELTEMAAAIQEGERADNPDFYGYVWQGNSYEGLTCDAHEWLASETGQTFISPEGEVNVLAPEWIAALERATGWVGTISPEAVTTYQEEDSRAVWQAGNAAFMRNWPYAYGLGNGEDSAVAGLFGYAPLPTGAAGTFGCLGGWQVGVSQYSDNVEAAVSVAAFLASAPEQKIRALSPQGANPTIPALYEDPELLEANPLFGAMGPILAAALPRPSGITAERYNEASTLFFSAVHSVLTGELDALTAMEDLEIDLQELLADMGVGS